VAALEARWLSGAPTYLLAGDRLDRTATLLRVESIDSVRCLKEPFLDKPAAAISFLYPGQSGFRPPTVWGRVPLLAGSIGSTVEARVGVYRRCRGIRAAL